MVISSLILAAGAYYGKKIYQRWQTPQTSSQPVKLTGGMAKKSGDEAATELAVANQETNHYLTVSGVGMGLATAGALFFPPLRMLGLSCTLYSCLPIFQETYKSLVKERRLRAITLDSVAVVGSLAAHYYLLSAFSGGLYFAGRKLLLKTEDHSRKKLVGVFEQQPRLVWLWRDGLELQVPFESIESGNVIVVNAGEVIPADGVIVEGIAAIDQRRLTGESQPTEKEAGDQVFAATVVLSGRLLVQVEKSGTATVAAQISEILNQTADYKSTIEARCQQLADRSVLPTLGIGSLAFLTQGIVGGVAAISANFSEVLRVASPLSMLNYLSLATQNGILIKDGRSLELLKQVDTVIFDKTGTLTLEQLQLGQFHCCDGWTEETLLTYAAAAEHRQTHPIAKAIQQAAQERGLHLPAIEQASYEMGYGLRVQLAQQSVWVGSARFMALEQIAIPDEVGILQKAVQDQGHSLIYVAVNERLAGVIELRPSLRPEAQAVIQQLKAQGVSLYIISGDQEHPTRNLAAQLGIDHYFAEVLPEEKANLVEKLQQEGRFVCFVGDGINDSIALKKAQVSISIRGASSIATDTAQIVLMDGSLSQLGSLFQLAQDFSANMKMTQALTLGPGVVCIGGVFFLHFGILSSLLLFNLSLVAGVANAMRPLLRQQLQGSTREGDQADARHASPGVG
jgi:heavy metal translocating P-type ATPase